MNIRMKSLERRAAHCVWAALAALTAQSVPLGAVAAGITPVSAAVKSASPGSTAKSSLSSSRPLNLDLSATRRTVSASKAGTILIGGHMSAGGNISGAVQMPVSLGQLLTPAMNAALWQSVSGSQHLMVSPTGSAIGGVDRINSSWASNIKTLLVPRGVRLDAIGFDNAHPLNVLGQASIFGSVHALQTSSGLTASLKFDNSLTIASSGLISGYLPASLNHQGLFASSNIDLNVANDFVNHGTVSAPGTLNIIAGGSLSNTSVAVGKASLLGQNINLSSGGQIANSGLISAKNLLNINSIDAHHDINIDNRGGVIQALGSADSITGVSTPGILNFRSDGIDLESANISLNGGLLEAGAVNAFGKNMDLYPDEIRGVINVKGSAVHLGVQSGDLSIGTQTLTGDPTYFNNNGDITLTSAISAAANIAVLASGNINYSSTSFTLSTNHSGSSILLAAGVNITSIGGSPNASTSTNKPDGTSSIIFNGASATGGSIKSTNALNLDTSVNSCCTAGGDVILIAQAGSNSGTGFIDLGGGTINTSGTGTGKNGNVTLIANGFVPVTGVSSIQGLGAINAGGGTGGASTPVAGQPQGVALFAAGLTATPITVLNGGVTAGSITANSGALSAGGISTGAITTSAANIVVQSGTGKIISTGAYVSDANSSGKSAGNITISTGGLLSMPVSGALSANGNGSGNGGNIKVSAASLELGADDNSTISANGGATGSGGTIIVSTNSATVLNTGAVDTSSGNDIRGVIQANAGTSGNGIGGNVTVVNNGGGINYSESIGGSISAVGAGTGAGGNIGLYALGGILTVSSSLGTGSGSDEIGNPGPNGGLANVALISTSDVSAGVNSAIILDESSPISNGGNIIVIAGANASYLFATNTLTVNSTSANNGSINFGGFTGVNSINTSSTNPGGSGGNFTAIAYGSGSVTIGGGSSSSLASLKTGGADTSGSSGNVTIVGGSGVNLFSNALVSINTAGGVDGSGTVLVASASPALSSNLSVVNGQLTGGGAYSSGAGSSGSVTTGNIFTSGASITVTSASGNISAPNSSYAASSSSPGSSGGNITVSTAGTVVMKSGGALQSIGTGSGNGGNITVSASSIELGDNSDGFAQAVWADGGDTGNGGKVIISTSSATSLNTGVDFSTSSGAGNEIIGLVQANAGISGNGTGGSITIVNNAGSINYGKTLDNSLSVAGAGTGAGGKLGLYALGGTLTLNSNTGSGVGNGGLSNLALVSSADVSAVGPFAAPLDESSASHSGGNVTVIAGANASYAVATNTLTVNTTSANNGSVNFSGATGISSIQTNSSHAGSSGGAFTAIAYGSGNVNIGDGVLPSTLNTGAGDTASASGNVVIIGGAGVSMGSTLISAINTTGGSSGTGAVTIASAVPSLASSLSIVDGNVTSGAPFTAGAGTSGTVKTSAITTSGAAISVTSGSGNISSANQKYTANAIAGAAGGNITVSTSGTVTMQIDGALTSIGNGSGKGGNISVSASTLELGASTNPSVIANGGASGAGGTVVIASNSSAILFAGAPITTGNDVFGQIQAIAGGGNAAGGSVTIVNSAGGVTYNKNIGINSISVSGTGTGAGGSVGLYALGTAADVVIGNNLGTGGANGGLSNLNIVAQRDIGTINGSWTFNESSTQNAGGNILLVAGANASYTFATNTLSIQTSSSNNGSINLGQAASVSSIQSGSTASASSGGSITAIAYGTGGVNLGGGVATSTMSTVGTSSSGAVTLIGGSGVNLNSQNNAVWTDIVTAGTSSGGAVTVASAVPSLSIVRNVTNNIGSGGTFAAGATTASAVKVENIFVSNSISYTVPLPAAPTLSSPLSTAPSEAFAAGAQQLNVLTAGALTLNGSLQNNGRANNPGGVITVSAASVTTAVAATVNANGVGTGGGGVINLSTTGSGAAADLSIASTAGNIAFSANSGNGATGNGGLLVVTSNHSITVSNAPAAANVGSLSGSGNGGQVYLTSNVGSGGQVTLSNTSISAATSATGNGNGGVLSLVADKISIASTTSQSNQADGHGTGSGGIINIVSTGNGNVLDASSGGADTSFTANGGSGAGTGINGGTLLFKSAGAINILAGTNSVAANAGNAGAGAGGNIFMQANGGLTVAGLGTSTFAGLSANGSGTGGSGSGGTIQLANTSVVGGNIQVTGEKSPTAVSISATGAGPAGTGGSISISSASPNGSIEIDDFGTSGASGTISTLGTGGGAAGPITISETSSSPFIINATSAGANTIQTAGATGAITGGVVVVTNGGSGGINLQGAGTAISGTSIGLGGGSGSITANAAGQGGLNAGTIALSAAAGVGSVSLAIPITITTVGATTLGAATSGPTAQIDLNATAGSLIIGATTVGVVSATGLISGSGLAVAAANGITLNNAISSQSGDISIITNAGTISGSQNIVSAGSLTITNNNGAVGFPAALGNLTAGGAGHALAITANGAINVGTLTNAGGAVTVTNNNATTATILGAITTASSTAGSVTLSGGSSITVNGGVNSQSSTGNGGSVSINESAVVNGTIKVAGQINSSTAGGSSSGGNVSLLANKSGSTTSTIEVDNGINANGGTVSGQVVISEINTGSSLSISADSASPGANKLGPITSVALAGQPIQISNSGGSVTFAGAGDAISSTGPINITAAGSIGGAGAGSGTLHSADTSTGVTLAAGVDVGSGNAVSTNTSVLNVTGTAGLINISNSNAAVLNINSASASGNLTISTNNGININSVVSSSSGGNISLSTSNGGISQNSGSINSSGNVSLTASNGNVGISGGAIATQAGSLSIQSGGSVFIAQTGTSSITGTNTATGSYSVTDSSGNLVLNSGINAASIALSTLGANNFITMGPSAGPLTSSSGAVSLSTNGGGINSTGGGLNIVSATTATLSLNTAANPLGNINLTGSTGQSVSINAQSGIDLQGAANSPANISTAGGAVTLQTTNGGISNVGSVSTSNISGNGGNVLVSAPGVIKIGGAVTAQGATGNASGGSVSIGSTASSIEVDGAINNTSTGTGTLGSVSLSDNSGNPLTINGAVPAVDVIAGTISSNGFVAISSRGGVILSGPGTAITSQGAASSVGINGGTGGITASAAGQGGINAANVVLQSTTGIGSVSGAVPITLTTVGNTTLGASATGVGSQLNVKTTAGGLSTGTVSVGGIGPVSGLSAEGSIQVDVAPGFNLNVTNGNPIVSSSGAITLNADNEIINGNVSSPNGAVTINATNGNLTSATVITATSLTLNAPNGNVGPLTTAVSHDLTVSAGGNINISNTGNLASFIASSTAVNGVISLHNNGDVTLGSDINGPGGVDIILTGSGNKLTNAGFKISANNAPINLQMDSLILSGTPNRITAGAAGTIDLTTSSASDPINLNGGSSGLAISAADLVSKFSAGTLVVGSNTSTGGITLNAPLNISGAYGLQLLQGGAGGFDALGNSITTGAKPLTINVGGAVSLGAINTSGTTLSITGGSVALNGNVGSAGDTISIAAQSGGITNGAITVSGQSLSLTASSGNIGPLNTSILGSLSAVSSGSVFITNTGALTALSGSAGTSFRLDNNGDAVLSGNVSGTTGVTINLNPGNTLIANAGNQISAANAGINIKADNMVLGTNPIDAGTGTVTIVPASAGTVINLAGGSSGLLLTLTELKSIKAGTLIIGSISTNVSNGGINLNGALDISGSPGLLPGQYNLQLLQDLGSSAAYNSFSNALTMGSNSFTVRTGGAISTGAISSASGSILTLSGNAITVNGTVGGGSTQISLVAASTIALNAPLTGANITLKASANSGAAVSQSAVAAISGPAGANLTIDLSGGGATSTADLSSSGASNNVASLTGLGAVDSTILLNNNSNNLVLNTFGLGQNLTVSSAGQITNNAALNLGALSLTGSSAGSNAITLLRDVNAATIILNATTGNIVQTGGGVTTPGLTIGLTAGGAQTATLNSSSNNVSVLEGTGAANGTINFSNGSNNSVALGTFGLNQNLTVATSGSGSVTVTQALSLGNVDLSSGNGLNVGNSITSSGASGKLTAISGDIVINGSLGGAFTGISSKTIQANSGTISISGPVAGSTVILTAGANVANAIIQTGSGTITNGAGATDLTINLSGGSNSSASLNLANNAGSLKGTGAPGSSIAFSNAADNSVNLGTFGSNQNLTVVTSGNGSVTVTQALDLKNVDITGGAGITLSKSVSSSGTIGNLTANSGNILIDGTSGTGAFIGSSNKTLNAASGFITIDGPLTGSAVTLTAGASGPNVITQTANGAITGPAGAATTLAVHLNGDSSSTASLSSAANNASSLTGSGAPNSSISFANAANNSLSLLSFSNDQSLSVTTSGSGAVSVTQALVLTNVNITSGVGLTLGTSITANGTTGSLTASSGNIIIDGSAGGAFVGGSDKNVTATLGTITLDGLVNGPNVFLTAGAAGTAITQDVNGIIKGNGSTFTKLTVTLGNGGSADLTLAANNVNTLNGAGSANSSIAFTSGFNHFVTLGTFTPGQNLTVTTSNNGFVQISNDLILGNVNITSGSGLTLDHSITSSGIGATGILTVSSGDLNIVSGGAFVGDSAKTLTASAGLLAIDGAVAGSAVTLNANSGIGAITQTINGAITGSAGAATSLTVNLNGGSSSSTAVLNVAANNVSSLSGSGQFGSSISFSNAADKSLSLSTFSSGQNLTVTTTGASTVSTSQALTLGDVNITAGNGITITNSISSNGSVGNLTTTNGNILIDATTGGTTGAFIGSSAKTITASAGIITLNGSIAGPTVALSAAASVANAISQNANGSISGTGATATILSLTLGGNSSSTANLVAAANNANSLTASGVSGSTIAFSNSTGNSVAIGAISNGQNLTVSTSGSGTVTTTQSLVLGNVNITAGTGITISKSISSNSGTAILTATNGDILIDGTTAGTSGSLTGASSTTIQALSGTITLNGAVTSPSITLSSGANSILAITQNSNGTLSDAAGAATLLSVNLSGGSSAIASLNQAANNASSLTGSGAAGSAILFANSSNNSLSLGTFSNGQSLAVSTSGSGAVSLTAALNLSNVDITSGSGLTIGKSLTTSGLNGNLTATSGPLLIDGSTGGAFIGASDKQLNALTGTVTIRGALSGGVITITSGASGAAITQNASGAITASTLNLALNGDASSTATLTAGANNVGTLAGTGIANSSIVFSNAANHSVNLGAFHGQNLTVSTSGSGTVGTNAASTFGNLTISSASGIVISNLLTVTGSGGSTLTATSGNIVIDATVGSGALIGTNAISPLTLTANSGSISINGAVKGSSVDLSAGASGANAITENANGIIARNSGSTVLSLFLNGDATSVATLTSGGNNVLTLNGSGTAGSSIIYTSAFNQSVFLNNFSAGQNLTVSTSGNGAIKTTQDLQLGNVSLSSGVDLKITNTITSNGTTGALISTGGNVLLDSSSSAAGFIGSSAKTITSSSLTGTIQLDGAVAGASVTLNSGASGAAIGQTVNGIISGPGATATLLNVILGGDASSTATLNSATNNVSNLTASGIAGSSVSFSNGANNVTLGTFTSGQNLAVSTTGTVSFAQSLVLGNVNISGAGLVLNKTITSNGATAVLNASSGNILIDGTIGNTGALLGSSAKTIAASAGTVTIDGAVAGSSVALSAGASGANVINLGPNGTISGAGGVGTAADLTLNLNGDASSSVNLASNVSTLSGSGVSGSTITFTNSSSNSFAIGSFSAGQNINISAGGAGAISTSLDVSNLGNFTLNAATVNLNNNIGSAQAIVVNTNNFNTSVGKTISAANSISLNSLDLADLNINNAGTLSAPTGTISAQSSPGFNLIISGGGTMSANLNADAIILTAPSSLAIGNTISFTGSQTFHTPTVLNAVGSTQSVVVVPAATVTGDHQITVNSNVLISSNNNITANQLVLNSQGRGTIANSTATPAHPLDLKVYSSLVFRGSSLAIISSSDIVNTGSAKTIDLSGLAGSGGGLVLMAGFTFNPGVQGTTPSPVNTTFDSFQSGTGRIILPGETIITSSTSGAAGSVLAVANGSISLGKITTTSSTAGGAVTIIGKGVTVGAIDTTGTISSGAVSISSAVPLVTPGIGISNGFLFNGSITPTAGSFGGNLSFNTIKAGTANVTLQTGGSGLLTQARSSSVTSGLLSVTTGTASITMNVSASALKLNTTSLGLLAGNATITDSLPASLASSSVAGILTIRDAAGLSLTGSTVTGSKGISLSSTATKLIFGNIIIKGSTLNSSGAVSISDSATPLQGGLIKIDNGSSILNAKSIAVTGANNITVGSVGPNTNLSAASSISISSSGANALVDMDVNSTAVTTSSSIKITASASTGKVQVYSPIVTSGTTLTISAPAGVKIGNGPASTLTAGSGALSIAASGALSQVAFGSNVTVKAGSLNPNAPHSPANLVTSAKPQNSNIAHAGTITVTGTGGVTGNTTDNFNVAGGNMTVTASKGGINFGDQTTMQVDGGSLTLTAGGGALAIGTSGATGPIASSITARTLNKLNGNITMTGQNGLSLALFTHTTAGGALTLTSTIKPTTLGGQVSLGDSSISEAHGAIKINDQGSQAAVSIGSSATIKSGFTNGPAAGALTITSSGTLTINGSADVESNAGALSLTATGALSALASSQIIASSTGGNIALKSGNLLTLTDSTVKSLIGSVSIAGTGTGINGILSVDSGSLVNAHTTLSMTAASDINVGTTAGPAGSTNSVLTAGTALTVSSTGVGAHIALGAHSNASAGSSVSISTTSTTGQVQVLSTTVSAVTTLSISGPAGVTIGDGTAATALTTTSGAVTLTASNAAISSLGVKIGTAAGVGDSITSGGTTTITGANGISIGKGFILNSPNAGVTMTQSGTLAGAGVILGDNGAITAGGNKPGALSISASGGLGFTTGANDAMTSNGPLGITIATRNSTGVVSIGDQYNIKANGGSISISSAATGNLVNALSIGKADDTVGSSMTATSANGLGGNITLSTPGKLFLGFGSLIAGGAIVPGSHASVGSFSANSSLQDINLSGTTITAQNTASIIAFTNATLTSSTNASPTASSVTSLSNLTLKATQTLSSTVSLQGGGVQLSAGSLVGGTLSTGTLDKSQVAAAGSLVISAAGDVTINGSANTLISNGSNLQITSISGNVVFGDHNHLTANGGNILVFGKGKVSGQTDNAFYARSVGPLATVTGGGIEIGAGLTASTNLTAAFAVKLPTQNPTNIGAGVQILNGNGTQGVVKVNLSGTGFIDLNSTNSNPATLNMPPGVGTTNGGAQVYDAQGSSNVKFDGGTFNTEGLKPISMVTSLETDETSVERSALTLKTEGAGTAVSTGMLNTELQIFSVADGMKFILPANSLPAQAKNAAKLNAQVYARANTRFLQESSGILRLTSGELLITAESALQVNTDIAQIQTSKGAIASIKSIQGATYVRSCSDRSTVTVKTAGGQTIVVNPGEEVLITDHKPEPSDLQPDDGLGRRNRQSTVSGKYYVTISEFAIITMISNVSSASDLKHSNDAASQRLLARMLKTAASIDTVLKYRGPYTARQN